MEASCSSCFHPSDVTALSDDEPFLAEQKGGALDPKDYVEDPARNTSRKRRGRRKLVTYQATHQRVLRLLQTRCRCAVQSAAQSASCYKTFASDEPAKSELVRLRRKLQQMHKLDADEEAALMLTFCLV